MDTTTRHMCALSALPQGLPDEIEVLPLGPFRLADKRGKTPMQVADAAALIQASFDLAPGQGDKALPIDFDHRSFGPQGQTDTRAAGWITGLRVDGDRIMASVEWTTEGEAALRSRSYRFVSPVFRSASDGRVMLLEGAGLVNVPALPQLRQLASKEEDPMDPIKEIAAALGLSADEPDKIVARVKALAKTETQLASFADAAGESGDGALDRIAARLKDSAPDPAKYVPMSSFMALQTELASLKTDVGTGKVDAALEAARDAGKLTPDLEDWARNLASKDLAAFEGWAAVAPQRVAIGERQLAGKQPPATTAPLTETERQVASQMGVSEDAFLASRKQEA